MKSPSKTIKRLWLVGIALAAFVGTAAIGNLFVSEDKQLTSRMLGHDFLAFYTAGTFLREGRSREIYDLEKVKAFQHELAAKEGLEIGESYGPFWNPPFYAWVFEPISRLSYRQAIRVWWGINGVCLVGALWMMVGMMRGKKLKDEKLKAGDAHDGALFNPQSAIHNPQSAIHNPRSESSIHHSSLRQAQGRPFIIHPSPPTVSLLIPLFLCVSMPFIQAFSHGQNTMTSLALLAGVVMLWRADKAIWAGMLGGVLLYKPQLGAVVAAALVMTMGWRSLLGLSITGLALGAVTLFTLPGVLGDYQRLLPANLHQFQVENVYLWDRHVTLRAFWRLLIQGRGAGEMNMLARVCWIGSCVAIVVGLVRAWWALRHAQTSRLRQTASGNVLAARQGMAPGEAPDIAPRRDSLPRDWFIASAIVAMPLLMPFYFDYDLLLVSVAAVLSAKTVFAETASTSGQAPSHRPLFWAWCGLYAWIIVNSSVARLTGVNGTVLLLGAIEAMLIGRTIRAARSAGRRDGAADASDPTRPPLAAAA